MQHQFTIPPEEWRPVVGYKGWYEVSSLGRLRRIRPSRGAIPGRFLRPWASGWGYCVTRLSREDVDHMYPVHTLVAEAFLGSRPTAAHEVNHKDGNKTNDALSNLEWTTRGENNRHAIRAGLRPPLRRRGSRHGMSKLTETDVLVIRQMKGKMYQRRIARWFNVTEGMVSLILHRRNWNHI